MHSSEENKTTTATNWMVIGDKVLMTSGGEQERKRKMSGSSWYGWGDVEICLQILIGL